jgi:hypothetical protein
LSAFLGGSAYAMATGIAAGVHAVTERTSPPLSRADLVVFAVELDRHLREVRAEQPPLDDTTAIQSRNRRISRLNTALMILRAYKTKLRG